MLQPFLFYVFASILVISALLVISVRNPVHSVLFLILCFIQAACLFILIGAEFIAMILIIVYVGAVAVLFLSVVMMLDINFTALREGFLNYLPIGGGIGLILLIELFLIVSPWNPLPEVQSAVSPISPDITNTHALGNVLYTDYIYLFQAAGIILLIAMIGAITLTLRKRTKVHKQNIHEQLRRTKNNVLVIHKIPPTEKH